jgi:antitoxin component of MazEF toxin-antitoxin module
MSSGKRTRVKFKTTIRKMGNRQIIIIPKKYYDKIKGYKKGEKVFVDVEVTDKFPFVIKKELSQDLREVWKTMNPS